MKRISAGLLVASLSLVLAACGASAGAENAAKSSAEAQEPKMTEQGSLSAPSVAFVCTGQLGDKSFNDSANEGGPIGIGQIAVMCQRDFPH